MKNSLFAFCFILTQNMYAQEKHTSASFLLSNTNGFSYKVSDTGHFIANYKSTNWGLEATRQYFTEKNNFLSVGGRVHQLRALLAMRDFPSDSELHSLEIFNKQNFTTFTGFFAFGKRFINSNGACFDVSLGGALGLVTLGGQTSNFAIKSSPLSTLNMTHNPMGAKFFSTGDLAFQYKPKQFNRISVGCLLSMQVNRGVDHLYNVTFQRDQTTTLAYQARTSYRLFSFRVNYKLNKIPKDVLVSSSKDYEKKEIKNDTDSKSSFSFMLLANLSKKYIKNYFIAPDQSKDHITSGWGIRYTYALHNRFSLQANLLAEKKGMKDFNSYNGVHYQFEYNYLTIPLLLQHHVHINKVSFLLAAGGYGAFFVTQNTYVKTPEKRRTMLGSSRNYVKSTDWGLSFNAAALVSISKRVDVGLDLMVNKGLRNILKDLPIADQQIAPYPGAKPITYDQAPILRFTSLNTGVMIKYKW